MKIAEEIEIIANLMRVGNLLYRHSPDETEPKRWGETWLYPGDCVYNYNGDEYVLRVPPGKRIR